MQTQKILLIGGPGTGKTSVLNALKKKGCCCFGEISRKVTLEAQKQGITQLFLEDPLLFSKKLLEGRVAQFKQADDSLEERCFLDRGIPDISAYLRYKDEDFPSYFTDADQKYRYDIVFIFPLWEAIYKSDNERYETLEEASKIQEFIEDSYSQLGYDLIKIPKTSVEQRVEFILKAIKNADAK